MQKNKRTLQKVASFVAKLSIVTAIICAVVLLININEADEIFKSSMGATIFFFFTVGIVLTAIGNTDIPNLTPGHDDDNQTKENDSKE